MTLFAITVMLAKYKKLFPKLIKSIIFRCFLILVQLNTCYQSYLLTEREIISHDNDLIRKTISMHSMWYVYVTKHMINHSITNTGEIILLKIVLVSLK